MDDEVLLVSQFRPPIRSLSLEFPAGLIDGAEKPAVAALRELKEETGFVGSVVSVSPPASYDPGVMSSRMAFVRVNVDMSLACNQHPEQELEATEATLVVHRVKLGQLGRFIAQQQREGVRVDGKVWTFAAGLDVGRAAAAPKAPTVA